MSPLLVAQAAQAASADGAPRVSSPPPAPEYVDEPIDLPTSGLPPTVVGFVVLGALFLVVTAGFWLLR